MKILAAVVIPPHLGASGAVNAAIALSRSLSRHCDIDVALMAEENTQSSEGRLRLLKRKATNPLAFTKGWLPNKYRTLFYRSDIASLVERYDVVHIHNPIPALEMQRIARACVAQRVPYVLTTHGFVEVLGMRAAYKLDLLESLGGRLLITRPLQFVLKHAHKVCCLAPQDQALVAEAGVPAEKLIVIPNGVQPSFYEEPTPENLRAVCEKFQLPLDKQSQSRVGFFLANHTRNKGLDILLEAFLGSDLPYCLIVGGKKRPEDFEYARYESQVKKDQRIVFTDVLTNDEIRALHHYADLFVFPSRADTLPLVILEAMAAGRPVLSTRVGGIPYQIDETCGRLVPPENSAALRTAMEDLFNDPARLQTMGQAALRKVKSQFNWDRSADMTLEVYREALGLPPSTQHPPAAPRPKSVPAA